MESVVQIVIAVMTALVASSGFWAFILKRNDKKDARNEMLVGLAHDRIMALGTTYIERGYIRTSEYENLIDYLFKPYTGLHGNGSAARVVEEVKRLPIKSDDYREEDINHEI